MRVLMVAPEPFREPRGTPISIYQRLRGLSELGHTVDLVTYPIGENVEIPGVRIHRTPRLPFIKQVKIGPSLAKLVLDLMLFWKAVAMLARNRYHVIHSHEEAAFFCALLGSLFRVRHLYDMHSSLPRQLMNFGYHPNSPAVWLFGLLEGLAVKASAAVITIGADLEQHVEKMRPAAHRIRIDNMPVQATGHEARTGAVGTLRDSLGLRGKVPVVYTGTLEPYQGIDLLLDSATTVGQRCPDVAFVLVGGRPQQVQHWRNETARRGLADRVRFVGRVSLEETAAYMEMAEILVSPRTGGISVPLKIYSYLLSGKPIVATRIPTHTLLLNDSIALLAEPTAQGFAEGIMRLAREPGLRKQLGGQGRRFAEERYHWDEYLTRLSFIYEALQPTGSKREMLPGQATRPPHSRQDREAEPGAAARRIDRVA